MKCDSLFLFISIFLGVAVGVMMCLLVTLLLSGCGSFLFSLSVCFPLWVYYVVYFVLCFSSMSVIYLIVGALAH